MVTSEQWNEIIKGYRKGKIQIGVNLPLARTFLMNVSTKYAIWALIIWLLLPLIICVMLAIQFDFWSIPLIIGFAFLYVGFIGIASYNFSMASKFLTILTIVVCGLWIFTDFAFIIPFIMIILDFLLIFFFYSSIYKNIIEKHSLSSLTEFNAFLENGLIKINLNQD